ncbi:MAG: penicillin-binding protein 2, partial [Verrucomicrobiae bacterium]|nr:penicillin-binding protein 2 [Verrucomicrobiae bacterium]
MSGKTAGLVTRTFLGAFLLLGVAPALRGQVETGAIEKPLPDEPVAAKREPAKPADDKTNGPIKVVKKETPADGDATDTPLEPGPENDKPAALGASLTTRTEARTFTLSIPAPRGQILDRNGYPLAQTRVAYYAAVNFPHLPDATDTEILRYAGERIVKVNEMLGANWDLPAETVLTHYKNRRWLPLTFSDPLTEAQAEQIREEPVKGLILHPVYLRHYPHGAFMSHVLGYVGKRPPRKLGPIEPDEALWGEGEGTEGLEESFDQYLRGQPGRLNVLFEADGTKLKEETLRQPQPGGNLVTTIDLEMQRIAERLLGENLKRGAMVVIDVRTGDVRALASWPLFDPNEFIPSISQAQYARLQNDPDKPLFPRAFRGSYPPASTFKTVVALAALEERAIGESSLFDCPTSWSIGDVVMHNWAKEPEGQMNVIGALARSCNTWFYQVGPLAGADAISSMARRVGLGEKTGLPLKAEVEGFVPDNRWWVNKYGYRMGTGDIANLSIGQGMIEVSPVQMARAMAAIANRRNVMKPRLVSQVQDFNHNVIQSFPVEERSDFAIEPYYLDVVKQGMYEVVNSGRGTGTRGSNDDVVVAGKTGTAQAVGEGCGCYDGSFDVSFAGFAPADDPRLTVYVVVQNP